MHLALKVDIDTLRGTREGVPRLIELLREFDAGATFLFSLGPDHTGRAIRRVLRPGFLGKVSRTSVLSHYGLRTLLYGTLLPGPDIARHAGDTMRSVRDQGFEVGVHCFDHTLWQDYVTARDEAWTSGQMNLAVDRFREVFGCRPHVHGAAGWQMTPVAFRLEEQLGFDYASDTRGTGPFLPVVDGRTLSRCPQLPTTLPTLDELLGIDGITEDTVAAELLRRTGGQPREGHVFTLHAELEGIKLRPILRQLLAGWRDQGYALISLMTLRNGLESGDLPRCGVTQGVVPGRSGPLACQGSEVGRAGRD